MDILVYLIICGVSAVPFFDAMFVIPLAIFGGTNIALSFLFGLAGNGLTLLLAVIFSEKARSFILKNKESKRSKRAEGMMNKLGLIGYALLAPMIVGTHITAIIGVSLGIDKMKMFTYTAISLVLWTVALSALIYFGIDFFNLEDRQFLRGLLER